MANDIYEREQAEPVEEEKADPGPLMAPLKGLEGHKKVALAARRIWESKDEWMGRLMAQWKVNSARRRGVTNARVRRRPDDDTWEAWFPKDASPDVTPSVNKAATLCRRTVSVILADPPAPELEPPSGEWGDVERTDFSRRVLLDVQDPSNLNTVKALRQALDRANEFGSGFVRYFVDPRGERMPRMVQARKDATTLETALYRPDTLFQAPEGPQVVPPEGMTLPNPQDPMGMMGLPPLTVPPSLEEGPYTTRYVRQDGTLTDSLGEAVMDWVPKLKREVLDGRQVRPVPHTATDISECAGVQCHAFVAWGQLKRDFPDLAKLDEETKKKVLEYRPEKSEDLLPIDEKDQEWRENRDERLVSVLTTYMLVSPEYEQGVYLISLGDCYVAFREGWVYTVEGEERPKLLPISQVRQWDEGRDSFYGVGNMELLGGGNELRAAQIGNFLDHLEKINRRKTFLPTNSIISAEQLMLPRATVLPMNPGGKPESEDIPTYPRDSVEFFNIMSTEMNDASSLQETGQGLESSNVQSGRQALAILGQVQAGLSELRQNFIDAYLRASRIELQLVQAHYDRPRRLRWQGDDGAYKEKLWSAADLVSTVDIRLKAGTMSMLAPAAKAQVIEHFYSLQLIPQDEMRDMMASQVSGIIGLQDDPFVMRIRRQIADHAGGPPDGWQPPQAPVDPMTGQPAMQQAMDPTGMPVMQPVPPPPDPLLSSIWEPVPSDQLPNVAAVRLREISRYMQSTRYTRWPLAWRAGADMEFQRMAMFANPARPVSPEQDDPSAGQQQPGQEQEPALTEGEKGMAAARARAGE